MCVCVCVYVYVCVRACACACLFFLWRKMFSLLGLVKVMWWKKSEIMAGIIQIFSNFGARLGYLFPKGPRTQIVGL